METVDVALSYAASAVLIGGGLYFFTAFIVFAWEAETRKAQPIQSDLSVVSTATVTDALPTCPFEPAVVNEISESMPEVETAQKSGDDAIAPVSGVPFSDEFVDASADAVPVEAVLPDETKTALPSSSPVYRGMSLSPIVQTIIIIPKEGVKFLLNGSVNAGANDSVNAGENSNDDAIASSSVPLPIIARSTLKIWTGRHRKKVVPLDCLPESLAVPDSVQRLRWRNTDVIVFSDLQTLAQIV